jgi:hypothetical protein
LRMTGHLAINYANSGPIARTHRPAAVNPLNQNIILRYFSMFAVAARTMDTPAIRRQG